VEVIVTKQNKSERQQGRKQKAKLRQSRLLGFGMLLILLAAILYFTWQETGRSAGIDPLEVPDQFLGTETAPIEIVEYGDFGCSACRAWHGYGIRDAILDRYDYAAIATRG
jgi:hypothetical protein